MSRSTRLPGSTGIRSGLKASWNTRPFCDFPGYKPVPSGWFKIVCWFYVGNTQKLTESGFMEKPGIEPATPGL